METGINPMCDPDQRRSQVGLAKHHDTVLQKEPDHESFDNSKSQTVLVEAKTYQGIDLIQDLLVQYSGNVAQAVTC